MRRTILYILLDTSESMSGLSIGSANDLVTNLAQHFLAETHARNICNAKIVILGIGAELSILSDTDIGSFSWTDVGGSGMTNINETLIELGKRIGDGDRNIIILVSDGGFTDEYANSLLLLMEHRAFFDAYRVSIAIGAECDKEQLSFFCDGQNEVMTVAQIDKVNALISQSLVEEEKNDSGIMADLSDCWD